MKKRIHILAAAVVLALAPALQAQTTTTIPSELNSGQNLVATKIANNFTNLAGGEDNALALVNALRAGGDVTLVTVVPPPDGSPPGTLPTTTETTFAVPTKPMGWGNVKIALALAQQTLLAAGITQPTPAQLQAALNGGDITIITGTGATATTTTTTLQGVLTQRASGMGWGQIAHANGTKVGPVVSTYKATNAQLTSQNAGTTTTTTTSAAGTTTTASGITTAAGAASGGKVHGAKGLTTASGGTSSGVVTGAGGGGQGNGNAYGRGLVSGTGAGVGTGATTAASNSQGRGAGVVSGAGVNAGSGVTTAHGGGNGNNAGGNGKGNGKGGG